jgi:outer membrane protein assembly factor BamB
VIISGHQLSCIGSRRLTQLIAFIWMIPCATVTMAEDWPMRGGTIFRSSWVESESGPHIWKTDNSGDDDEARNFPDARRGRVKWSAGGFHQAMCDPVIANGLVWIGTADPIGESTKDSSVLACFDEKTGEFLHQHVSEKLGNARQDWPWTGNTSSPFIQGSRLWFCTNRLDVICLDTQPLIDRTGLPTIEWSVDLKTRFNVVPTDIHFGNRATRCSIVGVDGRIFVNTTNSFHFGRTPNVDPNAPSLVCLNQDTGETIWTDNSPGENIARSQHCNPVIFRNGEKNLVAIGQGDGFVRAFDCATGAVVWQFDLNSQQERSGMIDAEYPHFKMGLLTESPVFDGRLLYFVIGDDREASFNRGGVYCIDPFGSGDISPEIVSDGKPAANPNSKLVWEACVIDGEKIRRSIAGLCVTDKYLFTADIDGFVRCFDKLTGTLHWKHDVFANVIGTPLVVGDTLYVADEDGDVEVLKASSTYESIATINHHSCFESSPVYANGSLFVVTRERLFAIGK